MHNKGKFYKTLFFTFAAFIFAGCENFIAGSLLKEEIEAKIEYEKTPFVNVFIQKSDVDDNGTLYPSADGVKAKVGESFKISYTASSTYYFLYWQALDSKKNILDSSVVKFDDPAKAATSAVVYIDSEVIIQAVTSPVPKAVVNFKKNFDAAGSIKSEDKNTFMMDEEFSFSFVPAEGYQFIKWQASNSSIEIKNPESISSKAVAKADGAVTITAVCALRPQVGKGNTNPTQTDSVCKDTNIIIDFDKPLGNSEEELSDIKLYFNNVELYFGEEEAFGAPYFYFDKDETGDKVINYSCVVIPAHSKYAVDVPAGKTSFIRVVLPDSLFTLDEEKNCIYLCPEGKTYSWTYKINENTNDKARISVEYEPAAGFVTGNNGEFNIGKNVEYLFKPSESSKFISWKWVCVPAEAAVVNTSTDNNGERISFYINEACDINVEAVTAEKLTVASFDPVSKVEGVAKNSDIVITFNKAIANTDMQSAIDKIKILLDGVDVKNCYKSPLISEDKKTIIFKADITNLLPVEKGTKIVTVIVPSDFYYDISEAVKVNLEEYTTSFVVNASTLEKANVNINAAGGTITPSGSYSYNLGDSFDVLYKPESGNKFTGWAIEKGSISAELIETDHQEKYLVRFYDDESKSTYKDCFEVTFTESIDKYQASFTVLEEISGCSIRPSYSLIPAVTSIVPAFSNSGTAFDENIEIEFNKAMAPACFEGFYSEDAVSTHNYAVSITDKNGIDLSQLFNLPSGSEDNKKWTIKPDALKIRSLLEDAAYSDIVVTVKTSAKDSSEDALYVEKEFVKTYRINRNHETIPPKIVDLKFASSSQKLKENDLCTAEYFNKWSDSTTGEYKYGDFSRNHVRNSLAFHVEVAEEESGFDKIVISERRVKAVNTQNVNEDYVQTVYDLSEERENTVVRDFEHKFKSLNDGIIELNISVWDKAGNKNDNDVIVYAIKDTEYVTNSSAYDNVHLLNRFDADFNLISPPSKLETGDKDAICRIAYQLDDNDDFLDTFYGEYKSLIEDLTVKMEYWNTEDHIYEVPAPHKIICVPGQYNEDGHPGFGFVMNKDVLDFNKTIYFKITVTDQVGNSKTVSKFIPACNSVTVYKDDTIKVYPVFDDCPASPERDSYDAIKYYSGTSTDAETNFTDGKTYRVVYMNPNTNSRSYLYGLPYSFTINMDETSQTPEFEIPEFEIVSVEPGPQSSSTMKVTLKLESVDSNIQYFYSANLYHPKDNKNSPYIELKTFNLGTTDYEAKTTTFELKINRLYSYQSDRYHEPNLLYVKLAAGYNGILKKPASDQYKCYDFSSNIKSMDNIPPDISLAAHLNIPGVDRSTNSLNIRILDDHNLKTDIYGYASLEYTVSDVNSSVQQVGDIEDLTEEEWNAKEKRIIKFIPAEAGKSSYMSLSFADFNAGSKYRIDGLIEDEFGNKKITKIGIFYNNTTSNIKNPVLVDKVNDNTAPKIERATGDTYSNYYYKFWSFDGENSASDCNYNGAGSWPYTLTAGLKDENGNYKDCFYLLLLKRNSETDSESSDPTYSLFSKNKTANQKILLDLNDSYVVFCDNKTLLFTAYSKYNLDNNINIWNRCAGKTGYSLIEDTDSYNPDLTEIPDGYYYRVFAVFAEGEMKMSKVKQK